MESFEVGDQVSAMVPGRVFVGVVERADAETVDVRSREGTLYERVEIAPERRGVVKLTSFGLRLSEGPFEPE